MKLQLEQFEGPYELLLDLIKNKELDITELALAKVTEQYLEYLDQVEEDRASELSDFLVVASKLLLLKSGELLPNLDSQEDIDEQQLQEQLKIYQVYKQASSQLEEILTDRQAFARQTKQKKTEEFIPPENLTISKLKQKYEKKVEEHEPNEPPIETEVDDTISLKQKVDHIRKHLNQKKDKVDFNKTVNNKENKTELIVSFLAILELAKQEEIRLKQSGIFGSINIANT
jgi:segregation and condensation protein A